MRRLPALVVTLVVVAVVTTMAAVGAIAWAIQGNDSQGRMGPGMMASGSSSTPGWWDDSWGSMMGMMSSAGVASEPEYLAEMVAHHQEAVTAAGELARSDRAEMRAFGESIVKTQSAQIQQMRSWLKDWYPEQSTGLDYRPMMRDLSELSGDQLDQAFLQDMIGHHMAAVMMSQQLLWRGTDHGEVAELARTIRDDQHTEIVQMQRWLAQWFDTDWRGGMGCGTWSDQGWGMGPGMMWGSGR
ncbi:protein of unknown function DUF305 [Nocardioides sp. JS614]|nr:protein of unknown function DUF305 [Nocardioides sp. JS614]